MITATKTQKRTQNKLDTLSNSEVHLYQKTKMDRQSCSVRARFCSYGTVCKGRDGFSADRGSASDYAHIIAQGGGQVCLKTDVLHLGK